MIRATHQIARVNETATPNAAKLWTVLAKCYRTVLGIAEASIEELGLCTSDFGILEALLHKGPLTIGEIQKKVLLASGSMTAAVDRLEQRGLVVRNTTSEDRRARVIALTPTGKQVAEKAFAEHAADLQKLFSILSEEEVRSLYNTLKKLGLAALDEASASRQRTLSERR